MLSREMPMGEGSQGSIECTAVLCSRAACRTALLSANFLLREFFRFKKETEANVKGSLTFLQNSLFFFPGTWSGMTLPCAAVDVEFEFGRGKEH